MENTLLNVCATSTFEILLNLFFCFYFYLSQMHILTLTKYMSSLLRALIAVSQGDAEGNDLPMHH